MALQIVEFAGTKSPAHEDHEKTSHISDNAGMKTPQPEMASQQVELTGKNTPTVQASEQHEKASLAPKQMDCPTFDLSLGLSPAIAPAKDLQIYTPTVQPAAQDWELPRVLSIEILSPTPETPANKAPVTIADDVVLYSYVVRLKNRERVKKKDEIYWFEKPKKTKGRKKKKTYMVGLYVRALYMQLIRRRTARSIM